MVSIYIYMHSDSWKMGIWTPPVLGQHGCPTKMTAHHTIPQQFDPDHLINLKLTWEANHQDSTMGTTFFYRTTVFFSQRIPRLCVVFWANHSLTHQILPERKPKTFHKLRPDVEKDLIFKNPRDFWPPNKQKPWLKTFCLSKSPISYGLWAWFLYLWLRKSCR